MFRKVLVPLNGSPGAEVALDIAEELAAQLGSKVVLLGVLEPSAALYDHIYNIYLERCAEMLERRIQERGSAVSSVVHMLKKETVEEDLGFEEPQNELIGHPAAEIVSAASSEHASLIVMAIQDYAGLWHQSLNSIADSIVRGCGLPLFLIPSKTVMAGNQRSIISRIMIPLDGSAMAEHALSVIREMITKMHGHDIELNLVHILPEKGTAPTDYPSPAFLAEVLNKAVYKNNSKTSQYFSYVEKYLNKAEEEIVVHGVKVNHITRVGKPDKEIIHLVTETNTSMVIMACHGRSGLRRHFIGSTAHKILQSIDASVLLLRPHKPHPIGCE